MESGISNCPESLPQASKSQFKAAGRIKFLNSAVVPIGDEQESLVEDRINGFMELSRIVPSEPHV